MAKETEIQWADSTLNLQMGCDGCELWTPKKRICYAGLMIDGEFGGRKGWPKSFGEPELFLDRLEPALKWSDLCGVERPKKPWISKSMPRLIFLNDMGDTFSKLLPLDWMAPLLPAMGASPHQFLLLTKRPSRAVEFSRQHPFPSNFWIGTSVTSAATAGRVEQLQHVQGGGLKFVSFEPIYTEIPEACFDGIQWAIFGGESGKDPQPTCMDHIAVALNTARALGVAPFVKQLGGKPYFHATLGDPDDEHPSNVNFNVIDNHGGRMEEWPDFFQVREFPSCAKRAVTADLL